MNTELDLIRAFRAEDALVDVASRDAARASLIEHIAATASEKRSARQVRRRVLGLRVPADVVALLVTVLVVVGVGAVILTARQPHARPPAGHQVPNVSGPPVLRNYSPAAPPTLPGQTHTADLAKPGVIAGLGGSLSGIFTTGQNVVNGVNETPFSITASGLAPNARGNAYAVWLLPAVRTTSGANVVSKPLRPRLLGVIKPPVGRDGKLAAEGVVPASVLNGTYLVRLTLQAHGSVRTPGRTVLEGFI